MKNKENDLIPVGRDLLRRLIFSGALLAEDELEAEVCALLAQPAGEPKPIEPRVTLDQSKALDSAIELLEDLARRREERAQRLGLEPKPAYDEELEHLKINMRKMTILAGTLATKSADDADGRAYSELLYEISLYD